MKTKLLGLLLLSVALVQTPVMGAGKARAVQAEDSDDDADASPAIAVAPLPAAPPPTIADVVRLLQSYRPDLARVDALRAQFNRPIPATEDPVALARAWHQRAIAAEGLGDNKTRLEALETALKFARLSNAEPADEIGTARRISSERVDAAQAVLGVGVAYGLAEKVVVESVYSPGQGFPISDWTKLAHLAGLLGNTERETQALSRASQIFGEATARAHRRSGGNRSNWMRQIEQAKGRALLRRGRLAEAERSFSVAVQSAYANVKENARREASGVYANPTTRVEANIDEARAHLADVYTRQQRLDEAEVLLRDVLKTSLQREGRNSKSVGNTLTALAQLYIERGRYAEAAVIADWSERSLAEAGLGSLSPQRLHARLTMASAQVFLGRMNEAVSTYDDVSRTLSADAQAAAGFSIVSLTSIRAYALAGRLDDALRDGDRLLARSVTNLGADHYSTAQVRAFRAMVLARSGRKAEARSEFRRAVTVLLDPAQSVGIQQVSVARADQLRYILGEYIRLLTDDTDRNEGDIAEAFRLADVARWQSVQKAVSGSALRAAAGTPELGDRIRTLQNGDDEVEALYRNLIALRSAPPDMQLPTVISAMEKRITEIKNEQARLLVDIRRQFPRYDALVNPQPVDVAKLRGVLRPNEALVSIYVTPADTYVWAVNGAGDASALAFHHSQKSRAWIAEQVGRLRRSTDLVAGGLGFDLAAGNALYQELLAPVESVWSRADTLLVVANDALGQIPFSMLPTQDVALSADLAGSPLSRFRNVPWLARKAAVAYLPSVSSLVTLRNVPESSARRAAFIGFGDPDFTGKGDAKVPVAQVAGVSRGLVRNLAVVSAPRWDESRQDASAGVEATATVNGPDEPQLNPLPDTRDEIVAIATALAADPGKDAYFGADANLKTVATADLRHRKVVAFATHGLMANDLPGLNQPALALAPPRGRPMEEGLLKLEDILKLSLDADLVVLSACNTAAADGTGSEAVSGLGRGFFYAGSRAVLATHWPVETVSARQLVTHLFERYARDPGLTRAKALQLAMLDVMDREMALDQRGQPVSTYAHPGFWALYALYGDPGR